MYIYTYIHIYAFIKSLVCLYIAVCAYVYTYIFVRIRHSIGGKMQMRMYDSVVWKHTHLHICS